MLKRVAENGWLLELDGDEDQANERVHRARRRLLAGAPAGLVEAIPAARSLLVRGSEAFDPAVLETLDRGDPDREETRVPRVHDVPFRVGGEDLPEVLQETGVEEAEFWERFCSARFSVGFLGFAPGFPYLYGLPGALRVTRRATPRHLVPAGSVALGGAYAGIYPGPMPGGWKLIGHTDLVLFDLRRHPAALLEPGDEVRFRRIS